MHETQTLTPFVDALGEILHRLSGEKIVWAITGSLASALQGVPFQVNDIDLLAMRRVPIRSKICCQATRLARSHTVLPPGYGLISAR